MLLLRLTDMQMSIAQLSDMVREERRNYSKLISGVVKVAQRARIEKNYVLSDELRTLLKVSGVEIVQGTAEYAKYDDIPEELTGRPTVDTWKFSK